MCVMGAFVCRVSRSGRSVSADQTSLSRNVSAKCKHSSKTPSQRQPKPPTTTLWLPHHAHPWWQGYGSLGCTLQQSRAAPPPLTHPSVRIVHNSRNSGGMVGAPQATRGLVGKVGGLMYLANMCAKVLGGLNPGKASCSERQRRYRSSRTVNCTIAVRARSTLRGLAITLAVLYGHF